MKNSYPFAYQARVTVVGSTRTWAFAQILAAASNRGLCVGAAVYLGVDAMRFPFLRGSEVAMSSSAPASGLPPVGTIVVFDDYTPTAGLPRVSEWANAAQLAKLSESSAKKAAASLTQNAFANAEAEKARQAGILEARQMKGQGSGGKKSKEKAGSRR